MSALGKVYGDFDSNGQLVEGKATPAERVIERSVIVTRTVTETPVAQPEPVSALIRAEPAPTNDLFHEMPQPPLPYPLAPRPKPSDLILDRSRDALLTAFGKATLQDCYLLEGESFQDMFARVSCAYADDIGHAQRLYDAMSRLWFMPATPILSNGGAGRGLPISCFLNDVPDSLDGIVSTWNENVALASNGGGIGTYWGKVRSIGEKVKSGLTSGIIPFIHVMDGLTLAISQGSLRRGRRRSISTSPIPRSRSSSKSARPAATSRSRRPQPCRSRKSARRAARTAENRSAIIGKTQAQYWIQVERLRRAVSRKGSQSGVNAPSDIAIARYRLGATPVRAPRARAARSSGSRRSRRADHMPPPQNPSTPAKDRGATPFATARRWSQLDSNSSACGRWPPANDPRRHPGIVRGSRSRSPSRGSQQTSRSRHGGGATPGRNPARRSRPG